MTIFSYIIKHIIRNKNNILYKNKKKYPYLDLYIYISIEKINSFLKTRI
jgi:hypothetical protein